MSAFVIAADQQTSQDRCKFVSFCLLSLDRPAAKLYSGVIIRRRSRWLSEFYDGSELL